VRDRISTPVLLLDAGDTLLGQRVADATQGGAIIEAMNLMQYDAMVVGQTDFIKGSEVVLERASEADFAVLSCNVVDATSGEPILQPYVVLERGGIRFGIIGVSEPEVKQVPFAGVAGIEVHDPMASVLRYLPEVEAQSDVVILLSHLGLPQDRVLAGALPGVDVIIGGRSREVMQTHVQVGRALIAQMGYDGEWLGQLDVRITATDSTGLLTRLDMGPEIADDPELASLVEGYNQRFPAPTPTP